VSVFKEMYRGQTRFDFVAISKTTLKVSLALVILSVVVMIARPFNLSIDFTGGVLVTVEDKANATVEEVRADLREVGFADARVQLTGDEDAAFVQVQTEELDPAGQDDLVAAVAAAAGADVNEVNVDAVGPTFGAEVTRRSVEALAVFLVIVSLFIAWRFEWKMALAALAALFHDLIIAGGIYAAIGFVVTPSTIIAVLTILGYSLYDTVVVFDKVTENVDNADAKTTYSSIINLSMNQVLMRSINTSLTSLLPVGSLLLVGFLAIGAETLREFALALFIGIALGTYSSLFVAAPLLARWKEREPNWERHRRKASKVDGDDQAPVATEVAPDVTSVTNAAPKPPKQRRKRR